MRVLIADDEVEIARALKLLLEKNKFVVDIVFDGTDAWQCAREGMYDVIVLDIMMPGLDGIEVLRRIRQANMRVPVLMLTAKGDVEDKVAGLDAGADDYLPKPFNAAELIARVKALSRRSGSYTDVAIEAGDLKLDLNSFELCTPGDKVRLNNKEFQLMELFMRYPNQVFSSERLMDAVWGMDSDPAPDVVWTYIGFLRKKMRELGSHMQIKTVRGAGYALTGESET